METRKLTQEDFDENPELEQQGLSIGDDIELPIVENNEFTRLVAERYQLSLRMEEIDNKLNEIKQ